MDPVPVSQIFGFLGSKAVFQGSDAVCANATFSCANPLPPCQILVGFDFPSLWEITKNYYEKCPHGQWLVKSATNSTIALSNKAAEALVGAKFKTYPAADIWYVPCRESLFIASVVYFASVSLSHKALRSQRQQSSPAL